MNAGSVRDIVLVANAIQNAEFLSDAQARIMVAALLRDRASGSPRRLRLAATIGVQLDAFDALVADIAGALMRVHRDRRT